MTPTYEPVHSDSFNRTIEKLEYGLGPLERVSTSMTPSSKRPSVPVSFAPSLTGTLITRYGVNANLSAEKQLILVSQGKVEHAGVFQEKLALLWNKYLEWCDIEWLQIDFRVGEIGVGSEIQK